MTHLVERSLSMRLANSRLSSRTGELLCEIRDRVALITLNRPEARNALSDHLTAALRRMIKQCGEDQNVGALLITGAGNASCAGGDVKAWEAIQARSKRRSRNGSPICGISNAP